MQEASDAQFPKEPRVEAVQCLIGDILQAFLQPGVAEQEVGHGSYLVGTMQYPQTTSLQSF